MILDNPELQKFKMSIINIGVDTGTYLTFASHIQIIDHNRSNQELPSEERQKWQTVYERVYSAMELIHNLTQKKQ